MWKKNDLFKSFYLANWKLQIKKTGDFLINACKCCSLPAWISLLLLGIFVNSNYNRSRQETLLFHDLWKWLDFFAKKTQGNKSRTSALVSRWLPWQRGGRSSLVLTPHPPPFLLKSFLVFQDESSPKTDSCSLKPSNTISPALVHLGKSFHFKNKYRNNFRQEKKSEKTMRFWGKF